jgi:hypothetical protein
MSNILYDMILMEADKISFYKQKDLELYYKDKYNNIVPLAQPYDPAVQEVLKQLLKRKRMRYFLTFAEGLDLINELNKSANRVLTLFTQNMGYDNRLKEWSIRDLHGALGTDMKFLVKSLRTLCEKDIIRFVVIKNKRTYMVNPIYFYRGSIKSLFNTVQKYEREFPRRGFDLKEII